jgi:hypothetical protein
MSWNSENAIIKTLEIQCYIFFKLHSSPFKINFKIIFPYFTVYCISVLQSVLIKYWHILLVSNCQGNILVNYLLITRTKTDNNQIKFRNIVSSKHQAAIKIIFKQVKLHKLTSTYISLYHIIKTMNSWM